MPKPFDASSTCCGVAPSTTRYCASSMYSNGIRFPTNPRQLPRARRSADPLPSSMAVAMTTGLVSAPHDLGPPHHVGRAEEVQTQDICRRFVTAAIASMSILEVLVARTRPGRATTSSSRTPPASAPKILEHGLDDLVHLVEGHRVQLLIDAADQLSNSVLREAATHHRRGVVVPDAPPGPGAAPHQLSGGTGLETTFAQAIAMPPAIVPRADDGDTASRRNRSSSHAFNSGSCSPAAQQRTPHR